MNASKLRSASKTVELLELSFQMNSGPPQRVIRTRTLITGGSSGIGLAATKRFVEEGVTVYITGLKQEALDVAVASSGGITRIQADSTVIADLEKL